MSNIDFSKLVSKSDKDDVKLTVTLASIARRRFQAETAGITVNGMKVYTDRTTQMKLTAATLRAVRDTEYVVDWKTISGDFVTMNSQQIIALSDVVGDYVQECYTREGEIVAAFNRDEFTDDMLETGWPALEYGNE